MVLESRLRSFEEERERAIESERAIQCDINQNPSIPADSYAPRELGDVVDSEMHDVCLGSITVDSSAACEGRAKRARRKLKFCTYDFSAVENPSGWQVNIIAMCWFKVIYGINIFLVKYNLNRR